MKLSHSKAQKYLECPKRYDYHYNKGIREKLLGSPLFFGTAFDEAVEVLLLTKKAKLTEKEKEKLEKGAMSVFKDKLSLVRYNSEWVKPKESSLVSYSKADFDVGVLKEEDFKEIGHGKDFCQEHFNWYHFHKGTSEVTEDDLKLLNTITWYCLYRKGEMLLEAYLEQIIPQIKEVISIQRKVSLPNDEGDEIIGYIDIELIFEDEPETIYTVDNKTSSKPYKPIDLDESDQLHTYAEFNGHTSIAYIVAEKNIRKREPRARVNILKGKASENHTEKVFDTYQDVLYGIRSGKFEAKPKDGKCFFFGKPCVYFDLCKKGKFNDKILYKKEEK